ncbi:MAG: methionyl-tRNA formyltransferase [Alphaproteobacteria bacterium]
MTKLRLVFMGTPDFALPALAALIEAGHEIACVYSQPPRRSGRGQRARPGPVQNFAEASGIPVRTPASLKDEREQEAFAAHAADAAIVAAYGLILPKAILDAPRLGCLNIHASLLPRWRGAAPIERAILAGDATTGVTIMAMDEGLDTGAMLLRRAVPIGAKTTAGQLHDRLAGLGGEMIVEALEGLASGTLKPKTQPKRGITYASKIDKDEMRLDWNASAAEIGRTIRAFAPRPGAWFDIGGERIRILSAAVSEGAGAPGTVLDERLSIACGQGVLRALTVQRAGKAAMESSAFLRGFSIEKGSVLATPSPPPSPPRGEGASAENAIKNPLPLGKGQGEGEN